MKVLIAVLASLVSSFSLAGDVLELPVSSTASTSATHQVKFTLGTVGFLQDVVMSSYQANTGTITVVNDTIGMTNTLGVFVFSPTSQPRITNSFPVQRGDYVQVVYSASQTNATSLNKASCWFKDVVR